MKLKKLIGVNLAILLGYSIICHLFYGQQEGMALAIFLAFSTAAHVLLIVFLSVYFRIMEANEKARMFIITAGLVALVGTITGIVGLMLRGHL